MLNLRFFTLFFCCALAGTSTLVNANETPVPDATDSNQSTPITMSDAEPLSLPNVTSKQLYDPIFGRKSYVYTAGKSNNPSIVLVHGIGAAGAGDWRDVIPLLQNDYYVIAVDLPGFGRNPKTDDLFSPDNYSQHLEFVINEMLGERSFHMIGHSMGAAVALRYAASYPDGLQKLGLIDVAGLMHSSKYVAYLSQLGIPNELPAAEAGQNLLGSIISAVLEEAELIQRVNLERLLKLRSLRSTILRGEPTAIAGAALVATNFSGTLRQVQQPTLILWGEQDRIAPLRTGQMLAGLLPNAELITQANAAHMPLTSHPAWVNQQLRRFFAQPAPATDNTTTDAPSVAGDASCKNQTKFTLNGHYDHIEIINCDNVTLQDITAHSLVIRDSNVRLVDSHIYQPDSSLPAIDARNSRLELTAGSVLGQPAIHTSSSRWDVFGSRLASSNSNSIIQATHGERNVLVFSVTELVQDKTSTYHHEVVELLADQQL